MPSRDLAGKIDLPPCSFFMFRVLDGSRAFAYCRRLHEAARKVRTGDRRSTRTTCPGGLLHSRASISNAIRVRSRSGIRSGFPARTLALRSGGHGGRPETDDGRRQGHPWHRDQVELYRLNCVVPAGSRRDRRSSYDTICNAAGRRCQRGHLSFGNSSVGIINWPTCLLYPEGPTAGVRVHLALRLPDRWKYATALKTSQEKRGD